MLFFHQKLPEKKAAKVEKKEEKEMSINVSSRPKGMTLRAKNESERIKSELSQLKSENKPLFSLIVDLADWINSEFDKKTVITMIYRTDEEQAELYKHSERYQKKPFKSPHQFWHAIDLRTWIYTEEEIQKIVKYLNDKYNASNYYKWTAKAHAIKGNAMHFHIQYVKA